MMIFSVRAFAFTLSLCIASFAANTNADCIKDLQSDEWTSRTSRLDSYYKEGAEDLDIADICENFGGDIFGYSGNTTCPFRSTKTSSPSRPQCLPKSCTEGDYDLLVELVANEGEIGTDEDPSSCTGDYVFEALGDGYPVWFPCHFQCLKEALYSDSFKTSLVPFETALKMAETSAGEGEDPDYSGLQEICEAIDGHDYFTYSGTHNCGYDEYYQVILKYVADLPACLPTACTSTEDLRLKEFVVQFQPWLSDGECLLLTSSSDLTFSGRDESRCESDEGKHPGKAPKTKSGGTGVRGAGKTNSSKSTKGGKVGKKGKKQDAWEYPN